MALRYDGSALYEDRDIGMGAGGDFIGLGNPGDIRAGPDLPVSYALNPSYFTPRTTSLFGRGRKHNAMTDAEINAAIEGSIYASDLQHEAITKAVAASNATQPENP